MRDPERIDIILGKIEDILKSNHELTIGKLLVLVGGDPIVYYMEDNELISEILRKLNMTVNNISLTDDNLMKIAEVWRQLPDLRFGQLICNLISNNDILKQVSDKDLADIVKQYYSM